MEDEIICPVLMTGWRAPDVYCRKDGCAFWDEKNQASACLVQVQMLERLAKTLDEIGRTLWDSLGR